MANNKPPAKLLILFHSAKENKRKVFPAGTKNNAGICICNYKSLRYNCYAPIRAKKKYLLLLQITVAVHEAVNTTCRINELALTGIERV